METARLFSYHLNKFIFGGDGLSELDLVSRAFYCLNDRFFLILKLERHEEGFRLVKLSSEYRTCVQKSNVDLWLILILHLEERLL